MSDNKQEFPRDFLGPNNSGDPSPVEEAVASSIARITRQSEEYESERFYWSGHGDIFGADELLRAALAPNSIGSANNNKSIGLTGESSAETFDRIKDSANWSSVNLSVVYRVPTRELLSRFRSIDGYPSFDSTSRNKADRSIDDIRLAHGWEKGRYRGVTCMAPARSSSSTGGNPYSTFVNFMGMKRSFGADFFRYYGPENISELQTLEKYPFHWGPATLRFEDKGHQDRRQKAREELNSRSESRDFSDNVPVHSMAHHLTFDYGSPELTWLIDKPKYRSADKRYTGVLSLRAIELLAYDQISSEDYQSLYLVIHFQAAYLTSDTLHQLSLMFYRPRNQKDLFPENKVLHKVVKLASDKLNIGLGNGAKSLFNLVLEKGNYLTNCLESSSEESDTRSNADSGSFEVPEFLRYIPSCFRTISAIPATSDIPPQSSMFEIPVEKYEQSWSIYWANLLASDIEAYSLFLPDETKLTICGADELTQQNWHFSTSASCLVSVARKDLEHLGRQLQPFAQIQTRFLDIQTLVRRQSEELSSLRLSFARMIKEHGAVENINVDSTEEEETIEEKLEEIKKRKEEIGALLIKFFNFHQYLWANLYFAFPLHRFLLEQLQESAGVREQYEEFDRLLSLQSAVVDDLVASVRMELDHKAAEDRDERNKKLEKQNEIRLKQNDIREKWNLGLAVVGAIVAGEPIGDILATLCTGKSDNAVAAFQGVVMILIGAAMFWYMKKDKKKMELIQQDSATKPEDQSA